MEFDVRSKINVHGKGLKRDAGFSVARLVIVYLMLGMLFKGEIDGIIIMLLIIYGCVMVLTMKRKMDREQKYYEFGPSNPTYHRLSEYGDPETILDDINGQIRDGKILFNDTGKPSGTSPETIITEGWFVHLNKKAEIVPLDKIVCAYLYDNVTKETPHEKFLPTHFKPIHLIITYGEGKEAIIRHSAIKYKEVLNVLDEKLGCKVFYTREMGTLYKTNYPAFLESVGRARGIPES